MHLFALMKSFLKIGVSSRVVIGLLIIIIFIFAIPRRKGLRHVIELNDIFRINSLAGLNGYTYGNDGPSSPWCSYITVWVDSLWHLCGCNNPSGYAQEGSRRVIIVHYKRSSSPNAPFHLRGLYLING